MRGKQSIRTSLPTIDKASILQPPFEDEEIDEEVREEERKAGASTEAVPPPPPPHREPRPGELPDIGRKRGRLQV